MKTENIIREGIEDCIHDFIYNNNGMVLTSNPPIYVNQKVCKICGRLVEEREQNFEGNTFNGFDSINKKFNLDDNVESFKREYECNWIGEDR